MGWKDIAELEQITQQILKQYRLAHSIYLGYKCPASPLML